MPYRKLLQQKKIKAAFCCALCIAITAFLNGSGYYTVPIFIISFFAIASTAFCYRKLTDRKKWLAKHQLFVQQHGIYDILLIGDSLTAKWNKDVWGTYFPAYKTANFGINGDFTKDVLWRVENGELKNIRPKLIVLLCGANDIGLDATPEDIVATIEQIINSIQQKCPATRILLLGIFPIEEKPSSKKRMKITMVNNLLGLLHYDKNVYFLDIGDCFLDENGIIHKQIMPDHLHLSKEGYKLFAGAIRNKIHHLLGSNDVILADRL